MNPKVTQLLQELRVSSEIAQGFLQKVHSYQQSTSCPTSPTYPARAIMLPNGNGLLAGDS